METITQAKLTCPRCGYNQIADIPSDACQFFYECVNCKTVVRPKEGDCCVFCSYADTPCPSIQMAAGA